MRRDSSLAAEASPCDGSGAVFGLFGCVLTLVAADRLDSKLTGVCVLGGGTGFAILVLSSAGPAISSGQSANRDPCRPAVGSGASRLTWWLV